MGIGALSLAVSRTPASARTTLVDAAASLVEVARTTAIEGVPSGRLLGVEGIAWLARAEAEWARIRWLAAIDAPPADEQIGLWQQSVQDFGYGADYEQARSRAGLVAILRATGQNQLAAEQARLALEVAKKARARLRQNDRCS